MSERKYCKCGAAMYRNLDGDWVCYRPSCRHREYEEERCETPKPASQARPMVGRGKR